MFDVITWRTALVMDFTYVLYISFPKHGMEILSATFSKSKEEECSVINY